MSYFPRCVILLNFLILFACQLVAQQDSGWRVSPEKINIRAGDDRTLQLLDDRAQELRGATWIVDDTGLAEIEEEKDGSSVVHAKAAGVIRVTATLGGESRVREIKIWPAEEELPVGTTRWAVHPIGREIGDLPAVPTAGGPNLYSLEQTANGESYLRAGMEDGMQAWTWLLPEKTLEVELVCGDWFGGALISANRPDSFTLYAVGKDGKLRWRHTTPGVKDTPSAPRTCCIC